MTVALTSNKASFAGSGSTGPFSFSFTFDSNSEIQVFAVLDGAITDYVENTHYTLTGAGSPSGGAVTTVQAVPIGTSLVVVRVLPLTQEFIDVVDGGAFSAEVHENAFDSTVKMIQQLQEQINRCLRMPKNVSTDQTLASGRSGSLLGFDSSGNVVYTPNTSFSMSSLTTAIVDTAYTIGDDETEILLINGDASDCVITPPAGDTILRNSTLTLSVLDESIHLVKIGTNWYKKG